jgi:hypothetical protein
MQRPSPSVGLGEELTSYPRKTLHVKKPEEQRLRPCTGLLRPANSHSHSHTHTHTHTHIQGDSGGKINIVRCDSMGHYEKKVHMNLCLILNDYRDRTV